MTVSEQVTTDLETDAAGEASEAAASVGALGTAPAPVEAPVLGRPSAGVRATAPPTGAPRYPRGRGGRAQRRRDVARGLVAPATPATPARRGAGLRRAWRQLTSMRTALQLLMVLALAAVPGSILPQRPQSPERVAGYLRAHPRLGSFLDSGHLFDVYTAPWFIAIFVLLAVSLAGCLVPRIRLHARSLRAAPPATPRHLDRLPEHVTVTVDALPADVLAAARGSLRGWRVRSLPDDPRGASLAAERGYLRETGNLVFHVSLLVMLAGIAVGRGYGYHGTSLVVEGAGFTNTPTQFSGDLVRGPLVGDLDPFGFTLDRLDVRFRDSGEPQSFDAHVRFTPDVAAADPSRPYDVRVNHPLKVGTAKTYLLGQGYAPHLIVRDPAGRVVQDAAVPFFPQNGTFLSSGVLKVPSGLPPGQDGDGQTAQLGLTGFLTPTTAVDPARGIVSASPRAIAPGLTLVAYAGDLGTRSGLSQNVFELDTSHMRRLDKLFLAPGQTWTVPPAPKVDASLPPLAGGWPAGTTVTFAAGPLGHWGNFRITSDPGKTVMLVGACGVLVGLVLSLRVRRRRVWVRILPSASPPAARPEPPDAGALGARPRSDMSTASLDGSAPASRRTVVAVGGLARSDPEAFAAEVAALGRALAGAGAEER